MKVIYPEKITAISASSEATNWPASNLLDKYRTNYWQSTELGTATLTVSVSGGANAVAIFNIPGVDTVQVVVKDSAGVVVSEETYDVHVIDTYLALVTNQPTVYDNVWAEYPYQSASHTVELTFTMVDPSDSVQAGIVRAGLAKEFRNPEFGIQEGLKDYSIVKELNNGAIYERKRNIVRTFSGSFNAKRDRDYYIFRDFYRSIGRAPFAAQLAHGISQDWTIFGRFVREIGGSHGQGNWSRINFEIEEAI